MNRWIHYKQPKVIDENLSDRKIGNAVRKVETFLLALALSSTAFAQTVNLYDQVDPFIGTSGGGLTSPAASLPFGMIQWGPATNERGYYVWEDTATQGFSLTHLSGTGCPSYGTSS